MFVLTVTDEVALSQWFLEANQRQQCQEKILFDAASEGNIDALMVLLHLGISHETRNYEGMWLYWMDTFLLQY